MNLEMLLSQKGLVLKSPKPDEIIERAKALSPKGIKLFYGETYDEAGNTIDSMKYYFFVAALAQTLLQEGFNAEPTILIADTAACRNVLPGLEYRCMELGELRADFVRRVNEIYGTNLNVVMMSHYINSPEFKKELQEVIRVCEENPELMALVEKSVPESKLEVEKKKGLRYSFDEITSILDLDVKVGPPREDLYDHAARQIALNLKRKQLMSLFLTPTFPLGVGWEYFFAHEDIEEYGITAYKGGSKRLHDHRILVGKTTPECARELINKSFISTDPELPNPVLDLGIVVEMAKQRLERDTNQITLADDFYGGKITPEQLKVKVGKDVGEYILSRF